MKAVAIGETFARADAFEINGRRVSNPCKDKPGAAGRCIADFLASQGVSEVSGPNPGLIAEKALRDKGIRYIGGSARNPGSIIEALAPTVVYVGPKGWPKLPVIVPRFITRIE